MESPRLPLHFSKGRRSSRAARLLSVQHEGQQRSPPVSVQYSSKRRGSRIASPPSCHLQNERTAQQRARLPFIGEGSRQPPAASFSRPAHHSRTASKRPSPKAGGIESRAATPPTRSSESAAKCRCALRPVLFPVVAVFFYRGLLLLCNIADSGPHRWVESCALFRVPHLGCNK